MMIKYDKLLNRLREEDAGSTFGINPNYFFNNTTDRDTYFSTNPLELVDGATIAVSIGTEPYYMVQTYENGSWINSFTGIKIDNTIAPALYDTTTNEFIPIKRNNQFMDSPIRYNPTLNRLESDIEFFATRLSSESASLDIGPAITLSEIGGYLQNTSHVSGNHYISVDYKIEDSGTSVPLYDKRDPLEVKVIINPDYSTPMDNVTSYSVTATNSNDIKAVYYRTTSLLSNFRLKVISDATGLPIKYIPSENEWNNNIGLTFPAGDVKIQPTTAVSEVAGTSYTVEMKADQPINLLGDGTNLWRAVDRQLITEEEILTNKTPINDLGFVIDEDDLISNSDIKVPTQQSVKKYVDDLVVAGIRLEGGYDAATNTPDLDVSPTNISKGYMYIITVDGTFFTTDVTVGDAIISLIDNPTIESDWLIICRSLDAATIKVLYESNANTNALTDAKKEVLDKIVYNSTGDVLDISSDMHILNGKIVISNETTGDGGWDDSGVHLINDKSPVGEVAITYKNIACGNNQWILGLNQDATFKWNYGTSFVNPQFRMSLTPKGVLTTANYCRDCAPARLSNKTLIDYTDIDTLHPISATHINNTSEQHVFYDYDEVKAYNPVLINDDSLYPTGVCEHEINILKIAKLEDEVTALKNVSTNISRGSGYSLNTVVTQCVSAYQWYKVDISYDPTIENGFVYNQFQKRWDYTGLSTKPFSVLLTLTGSHEEVSSRRILWKLRVNGDPLTYSVNWYTIDKNSESNICVLCPGVTLNTNDYIELYVTCTDQNTEVHTSYVNILIQ